VSANLNSYDALKKYIYQFEKQQHDHDTLGRGTSHGDLEVGEHAALLEGHGASDTDVLFIPLLDRELRKITLFHESQEKDLMEEFTELEDDVERQEEVGLDGEDRYLDQSDDEDDDESISISQSPERVRRQRKSSSASRGGRVRGRLSYFFLPRLGRSYFDPFKVRLKIDAQVYPPQKNHATSEKVPCRSQDQDG
jgi:phosphate transporter